MTFVKDSASAPAQPPPRFWSQRLLVALDQLEAHLPRADFVDMRKLLALMCAQADAFDHISSTLNKAQIAQAELVMNETMHGFGY